ncbi:MAG: ABC transporter substrate-binding protein [Beijerinckiaceae bacterium]|nr:ABC transporter substrate-binding protein [Beijerinckiaceae bacterium]
MPHFPKNTSLALTRRAILVGSAAVLASSRAMAAPLPVFKLGTLPLGTASWEAEAISRNGLDAAAGIKLEVVKLASNEAARIAFVSGSVDSIVSDLIFAARLRAEGKKVRFLPFSSSEGGVMVAAASPVTTIAELAGKSIGVAGGPLDKSWILLRAVALQQAKLDLQKDANPVFGAPPLLSSKLERGEIDAALLFWNFCARLEAKGFRQLTSAQAITAALGIPGNVALLGYLVHEDADPAALAGFAKASRAAKNLLASHPDAWTDIRPLMEAPDQSTFESLKRAFISGIPNRPRAAEIADATSLFALLAKLGGESLTGAAKSLPEGLYVDQALYG